MNEPTLLDAAREARHALVQAATWFDGYAALHGAKNTDDGRAKEITNSARAATMRHASDRLGAAISRGAADDLVAFVVDTLGCDPNMPLVRQLDAMWDENCDGG